jgi:predicted nucleic acid-binding protein
MTDIPRRLLLDTNVFIIGFLDPDSPEAKLLLQLEAMPDIVLVFSNDLEVQIRRVGKRVQNADWVGLLLHYIWSTYQVEYVYITPEELAQVETISDIPREDIGIYLTALRGKAECLISANHELLREATAKQNKFLCLNAKPS